MTQCPWNTASPARVIVSGLYGYVSATKWIKELEGQRKARNVNIGGVAWAQTIGISKVEVKIDSAEFVEATLADQLTVNTWRPWSFAWSDTKPGRHRITVRATDANGVIQTEDRADPVPNGASGWMSIFVDVGEA